MSGTCKIFPTVTVNNKEVDSQLFKDLLKYTGSREAAKSLWAASKILDTTNMAKDANGEVTLKALREVLELDSIYGGAEVEQVKADLNVEDKDGNPVYHKNVEETIDKVIKSNDENPKTVASVRATEKGAIISVESKNINNHTIPEQVKFGSELNRRLQDILRGLGLGAAYSDNPRFSGMFSPEKAIINAEGLRTVIQIAKGEVGEEAFPEEFSHIIIEGLLNNPLVQRLVQSLNREETIKKVLGEQYQRYVDLYNGDMYKLQLEAAGKLLAQHIRKEATPIDRGNLLSRIFGFIKDLFDRTNTTAIDNAIYYAHKYAEDLSTQVFNEELYEDFDLDNILNASEYYDVNTKLTGMAKLLDKAIETASRRMKLLADRSPSKEYAEYRKEEIYELNDLMNSKEYAKGCVRFLQNTLAEAMGILNEINEEKNSPINEKSSLARIRSAASLLRRLKEFLDGYTQIVNTFRSIEALKNNGEVKLSDDDVEAISSVADEVSKILNSIDITEYTKLRYNTVFAFLKKYWGEDKIIKDASGKIGSMTLKQVMDKAAKDINFVDRLLSSMSDASDPLLSLIDKVLKDTHNKRDLKIQEILAKARTIHQNLIKSGNNTDFMYERDSNGKLTGYIISNINYAKYNKARKDYVRTLMEDPDLSYMERKNRLREWEGANNEPYEYESGRIEMLPNSQYYYSDEESPLNKLNDAQREYYDNMMNLKRAMDSYLPDRTSSQFKAPQIRTSMVESIIHSVADPKQALRIIKSTLQDSFIKRSDDTEFGEDPTKGNVVLDFAGKKVERLPIYFINNLEDMSRLSTDFTSSIMAYAGMAINYNEMNNIIDVMEVTREFAKEREVQQTEGNSLLKEVIQVLGRVFSTSYTVKGDLQNIGKRLDDYYESNIYGKRHQDMTITVFGKDINVSKTLDSLKNYTGVVGLGLNLFAGISNVVQGKLQLFFEGVAGEYFNMKDLATSIKNYWVEMPGLLAEINSPKKTNKLALLIERYDALEEFYEGLSYTDYYKGPLARIIGNTNLFILNNLGEHYLHARNMLAILNNIKVKDKNGNEISMYDAYKTKTDADGVTTLVLEEGITDLNGNLISTEGLDQSSAQYAETRRNYAQLLSSQKMKIGKINQAMNGAFNADDKGAIHRNALGRLAMQFRQWMPAHYSRRFASRYYDAALDQQRIGYYRTFGTFLFGCMQDLSRAKVSLGVNWDKLTEHERANVRRAAAELAVFFLLSLAVCAAGNEKDKKTWTSRMAIYQLKRAKLETGASVPWYTLADNLFEIIKSPAAAINRADNLIDLIKFHNMFSEIQSGRYKGMSVYEKDLIQAMPVYGQAKKVFDLKTQNYMFQIVN